jgi:hypothetical protein
MRAVLFAPLVVVVACGAGTQPSSSSDGGVGEASCVAGSGSCIEIVRTIAKCWAPKGTCSCVTDTPPEVYRVHCCWTDGSSSDGSHTPSGMGGTTWANASKQTCFGESNGALFLPPPGNSLSDFFSYDATTGTVHCADDSIVDVSGYTSLRALLGRDDQALGCTTQPGDAGASTCPP